MSSDTWIQVIAILLSPLLALVGVGLGARLTTSGQERQWLRDSRLQVYSAYLLACNAYAVASRLLEGSMLAGHRADQEAARDEAQRAIKDVITCQESVLVLGSSSAQAACTATTSTVFARNEVIRNLLQGNAAGNSGDLDEALQKAIGTFRDAVRSELVPGHLADRRDGGRRRRW
jgi:hypothetical protein